MFAKEVGIDIGYNKILVQPNEFDNVINDFFFKNGGTGCNVTVPFKEEAFKLVKHKNHAAELAKAVNTIFLVEGVLHGYNTDGIGLVNDLLSKQINIKNANVTLLGAGGAARGAIHPLLEAGVKHIYIVNRSRDKATALADEVTDRRVTANQFSDIDSPGIIINSTSASLYDRLPDDINAGFVSNADAAYDMVYSKQPTRFMQFAMENGVLSTFDGLGMLVEQAAEAFRIWTNHSPSTETVKQSVISMNKTPSNS